MLTNTDNATHHMWRKNYELIFHNTTKVLSQCREQRPTFTSFLSDGGFDGVDGRDALTAVVVATRCCLLAPEIPVLFHSFRHRVRIRHSKVASAIPMLTTRTAFSRYARHYDAISYELLNSEPLREKLTK